MTVPGGRGVVKLCPGNQASASRKPSVFVHLLRDIRPKKEKATTYQAAAEALELVEERTNKDRAVIRERLREPELIRE